MSEWRIRVDGDRCIGSGLCAATAPGGFQVIDGRSEPVADRVAAAEEVIDAADMCPVEAISVWEADTGRPVTTDPGGLAR